MNRLFFKSLIVIVLLLASGVKAYTQKLPNQLKRTDVTQLAQRTNSLIPVAIPRIVKVIMKQGKGKEKSGRLIAIDSKQITLFSGKNSTVMIADINKMVFEREVKLFNGGTIVIRGDNNQGSANNNQKIWKEPISNFRIKDYKKGKAEVTLTSVTNPLELNGIIDVSKDSSYVVEGIKFEPSDQMKIKVTPH